MYPLSKRPTMPALCAALITSFVLSASPAATADDDVWPMLRKDLFGTRAIADGDGAVMLDAPERGEDAAIVPITVRIPPTVKGPIKALTLIIDKNPAPVAATFTFGAAAGDGGGERRMSTRVRIDMYSHVRAVVETADGELHMAARFVKAAGGCSAPVPKDSDDPGAQLGKIMVKSFESPPGATPLREAQIMIRHPNNNGMQMDPLTRNYIPARFVKEMLVERGGDLVFRMQSGISISSDPNFRFTYANGTDNGLNVIVTDTDEAVFTAKSMPKGS